MSHIFSLVLVLHAWIRPQPGPVSEGNIFLVIYPSVYSSLYHDSTAYARNLEVGSMFREIVMQSVEVDKLERLSVESVASGPNSFEVSTH
jgi:hypothetical protein